ncbi:MAG: phenylalanine--tRNA ligase subunit alpha, partial [Calditrichota bacterium]
MEKKISQIKSSFLSEIQNIKNQQEFESLRVTYLGRKGRIQELYQSLKSADPAERPKLGKEINDIRTLIEEKLEELKPKFSRKVARKKLDYTLPGRIPFIGRKHPLTQILDEIKQFFLNLGFNIAEGPEVETDFYNFGALNFPKNHPARDMQDTLFITEDILLRTHTSPVQIRTMMKQSPPVRIIAPGRV